MQSITTHDVSTTKFDGSSTTPRIPDSTEIKPCPQCNALIAKINDGGCNHIVCSVCHCHFCWLCLREVSEIHFLSPSGCTFWGNDLWSTRKRILFQILGILCSPLIVICIILLSIPAILVAMPILTYKYTTAWSRKVSKAMERGGCFEKTIIWGATILSILVSPVAAACGAIIVAPVSVLYVFCIVPHDLIRNGTMLNQANIRSVEQRLNRLQNINKSRELVSDVESSQPAADTNNNNNIVEMESKEVTEVNSQPPEINLVDSKNPLLCKTNIDHQNIV